MALGTPETVRRRPGPAALRRRRLAAALAATVVVVALVVAVSGGGPVAGPPLPGIGRPAKAGDPFAYVASRQSSFEARATAGTATVVFQKSPGGVVATAARVARYRNMIDAAARGSGIDPNIVEGIVFLESAGRPDVLAGNDAASAAGLTQILAQTGTSLLGMHIDLARSRTLTAQIDAAANAGDTVGIHRLQARRAKIDDRFDPRKAIAATVRYLELAKQSFGGRPDLAAESYHMGIGNLHHVLSDYNGGAAVPYAQLYFDTAFDRHRSAYDLLTGFGDDSSLYYWRVLGSVATMRLYRTEPSALARLASLETSGSSTEFVLHPPDATPSYGDPSALSAAYARRELLPLPANAFALGLQYGVGMGSYASRVGAPVALYRGLRPTALDMLIELAFRVRALSGDKRSLLTVASTVVDMRYQRFAQLGDPSPASGWSFQLARTYSSRAQALALQAMLDRLQALNLIAWSREGGTIDVTVAADASKALVDGP